MENIYTFILNNIIIVILLISILFIFILFEFKEYIYSKHSLYPPKVVELLNDNQAIIIDVRTKEEFKNNHIINSVNIPEQIIKQNIIKLIKYKKLMIIILHNNNYKAKKIITILNKLNISNVKYIYNGLNEWIKTNLPITN